MKFEIEPHDIEAIAKRVSDILRPLISRIEKIETTRPNEAIFDVQGLADYLHVNPSWIYKQVSLKAIPYFKTGKYPRFRKKDIDRWTENQTARPVPALKVAKSGG